MQYIGQRFAKFLARHKMKYDKVHGKRSRTYLAVRSTWITHQVNKGVTAYMVAQSAGTSLQMLEQTYYKTNAASIKGAFKKSASGKSNRHLTVVK